MTLPGARFAQAVLFVLLCSAPAQAQDVEELLTEGEQAFVAGKMDEALEAFAAVVAAHPERWEGYYYSGMVLQTTGKIDGAIEMYEKALELKPDATEPLNNLAVAYLDAGKLPKALATCEKALAADPENFEAAFNKGIVLEKMGNPQEATLAFVASAALAPEDPDPYLEVAAIAFAAGDSKGAGEALALAFARAPHQLDLGLKALELLMDASDGKQASQLAKKLAKRISAKPHKDLEAAFRVARALRQTGDPRSALELLASLGPEGEASFSVATEKGLCHLAMGDCKAAAKAFDAALDIKPGNPAALLAKADALCCAHKWCKAKKAYKQFLAAAPADHPAVPSVKAKLAAGKKSCKNK